MGSSERWDWFDASCRRCGDGSRQELVEEADAAGMMVYSCGHREFYMARDEPEAA